MEIKKSKKIELKNLRNKSYSDISKQIRNDFKNDLLNKKFKIKSDSNDYIMQPKINNDFYKGESTVALFREIIINYDLRTNNSFICQVAYCRNKSVRKLHNKNITDECIERIKEIDKKKKEKIEQKEKKKIERDNIFKKAKETGEKQLLNFEYKTDGDDRNVSTFAMPDGKIKTEVIYE